MKVPQGELYSVGVDYDLDDIFIHWTGRRLIDEYRQIMVGHVRRAVSRRREERPADGDQRAPVGDGLAVAEQVPGSGPRAHQQAPGRVEGERVGSGRLVQGQRATPSVSHPFEERCEPGVGRPAPLMCCSAESGEQLVRLRAGDDLRQVCGATTCSDCERATCCFFWPSSPRSRRFHPRDSRAGRRSGWRRPPSPAFTPPSSPVRRRAGRWCRRTSTGEGLQRRLHRAASRRTVRRCRGREGIRARRRAARVPDADRQGVDGVSGSRQVQGAAARLRPHGADGVRPERRCTRWACASAFRTRAS